MLRGEVEEHDTEHELDHAPHNEKTAYLLLGGRRGVESDQISEKKEGGMTGSQFLQGSCWERGGGFFQSGCSFYIKINLKSEIFNNNKSFFLCHN